MAAITTIALHCHPLSSHLHHRSNSRLPITSFLHSHKYDCNRFLRIVQNGQQSIQDHLYWKIVNPRTGVAMGNYYGDDIDEGDDEDDEDEEEDRSLDLLIRFVDNVFKKVSRKARKAVKSVLPVPISTRLVGFAVNGTIILTFLWVLKAFLEVICTLGSVVFTSILLIRGVWTAISYFQESRNYRADDDMEPKGWTGTRPSAI